MHLSAQAADARFAHRRRFQILRRNWAFVLMEELMVLASLAPEEIAALLAEAVRPRFDFAGDRWPRTGSPLRYSDRLPLLRALRQRAGRSGL